MADLRHVPRVFQFLIGRIGTAERKLQKAIRTKFQFLIGRIGTMKKQNIQFKEEEFQFLIGRIGTLLFFTLIVYHRFCFNSL